MPPLPPPDWFLGNGEIADIEVASSQSKKPELLPGELVSGLSPLPPVEAASLTDWFPGRIEQMAFPSDDYPVGELASPLTSLEVFPLPTFAVNCAVCCADRIPGG